MERPPETPPKSTLQERLCELRERIAISDIVACGGEHEQRIVDVYGNTRGALLEIFRSGKIYRDCNIWRCPSAATTLNCAHRTKNLGAYVYRYEIHELTALHILSEPWNRVAEELASEISEYDGWIASHRLDVIPSRETRLERQAPLLQKLRTVRETLLQLLDTINVKLEQGEAVSDILSSAGCPLPILVI